MDGRVDEWRTRCRGRVISNARAGEGLGWARAQGFSLASGMAKLPVGAKTGS